MKILPVLDLRGGQVVRAVAGRRDEYRALETDLTQEVTPAGVATALRRTFGFREFYVADLDSILLDRPAWSDLRTLVELGLSLTADLGIRSVERAQQAVEAGIARVVIGLETCPPPHALREIVDAIGSDRAVFSLDLKSGQPMATGSAWPDSPLDIARAAHDAGITSLIVLDLAAVGETRGLLTVDLCRAIRHDPALASLELLTGGGIRRAADIDSLAAVPVDGVLVSSALHGPGRDLLRLPFVRG